MTNGCLIRMSPSVFSWFFLFLLTGMLFTLTELNRDCHQDCLRRNIWGNLKIKLLDPTFWQCLSKTPEKYGDRFQKKLNLLDFDFAVMPICDE
jgi:hypothetical protein